MNRSIGWVLAVLMGSLPSARAQEAEVERAAQVVVRGVDERRFPELTLDFEVRDKEGAAVLDAMKDDFKVLESGQPVVIERFDAPTSKEVRPTRVVLVVDESGSMMEDEDRMTPLKRAVATFMEVMPAGSRVAVVSFNSRVRVISPFGDDQEATRRAVQRLEADGGTRFYDAVSRAIDLLAEEPGRRAILALTDGMDTQSQEASLQSVIEQARAAGVPVHTLGVGTEEEIATDELQELAESTRGRYFSASDASELLSIYEEVARRLGESYSLSYRSARPPDGTLRPVEIFYGGGQQAAGTTEVYVRGMVVPAGQWNRLFLLLMGGLGVLAFLPGWWRRRGRSTLTTTNARGEAT